MAGGEAEPEWRRLNRANWDERVPIHLGPRGYDFSRLREGGRELGFVKDELGSLSGLRILHLQCQIGTDSIALARLGASVTGVDFSAPAIDAAAALASEHGVSERCRFVQADLYEAPAVMGEAGAFDAVVASWGPICWLPDLKGWARIVAHFLRPGGFFYFAEGHPAAAVLEEGPPDDPSADEQRPRFEWPYLDRSAVVVTDGRDYADPEARLANATTHQWLHPIGDVVTAVIEAGLRLEWLHEHGRVPWKMLACLVRDEDGFYRWPGKPWLPLAYSLRATKQLEQE
jgi:SAM-dependent methyltransferase